MTGPTTPAGRNGRAGRLLAITVLLAVLVWPLAAAPTAAATDDTDVALAEINTYRSWAGLPPMRRNPALDASAGSHARYYQLNYGDASLSGMGLHTEQSGKPGFTGEDMQDRAQAQGYKGSINENIGLSGSMVSSVDWFIATINHRLTLIDPRYTDIGLGMVNDGKVKIEVIDVGAPSWSDTATPDWIAWPPDGTTGVGLSFWGEAPDPFPDASYPVGYPITLKYHGPGSVSFDSATLTTGGQSVPLQASTGSGWLTKRTYMIAATKPLAAGTDYTITVGGNANGTAFTRTWSFRTAVDSGEPLALSGAPKARTVAAFAAPRNLPPGLKNADSAVQAAWWEDDGAVSSGDAAHTWLWGPDAFAAPTEPYLESPGGQRQVYYFDKGRMEITHPDGDRSSSWFVTNGLLVRDMILGSLQVGDDATKPAKPANVPLAGDPLAQNPGAPTYASLTRLATPGYTVSDQTDQPAINTLAKDGTTGFDASLADGTKLTRFDKVTGHNVAGVFADWMSGQSWDPLAVIGRPITEPYWVRARVSGTDQRVLVQAFERRVLTYTPSNSDGWKVEAGNVGRAYYEWRYGAPPGS